MVGAATTSKYVFDLQPGDVYWCSADCGWITGHTCVRGGRSGRGIAREGVAYYGLIACHKCGRGGRSGKEAARGRRGWLQTHCRLHVRKRREGLRGRALTAAGSQIQQAGSTTVLEAGGAQQRPNRPHRPYPCGPSYGNRAASQP